MTAVDFGFEAHAVGHGAGEISELPLGAAMWCAKDWTDIDFTTFEETTAQDSIRGESQSIAS